MFLDRPSSEVLGIIHTSSYYWPRAGGRILQGSLSRLEITGVTVWHPNRRHGVGIPALLYRPPGFERRPAGQDVVHRRVVFSTNLGCRDSSSSRNPQCEIGDAFPGVNQQILFAIPSVRL
jgi:hypothetical protein